MSRNHCRQRPALSWLLPSRYGAPPNRPSPGTAASCRRTSVFFSGRGHPIQAVVPIERWDSYGPTKPEPIVEPCRSGSPVTTCAREEMPSSAATDGCTGPMIEPDVTSGGSFAAATPESRTSFGS